MMKSLNSVLLSLFMMMFYSFSYAENELLKVNDAISISLENNNRYKIAREKVNEKEYKVREVWGELWPELGSGASGTMWGAEKGSLTGSDGQYNLQIIKGSLAVNPGGFYNRLQSSMEEKIITVNEERKVKADTTVTAIQLYYRVLLAQDMVKLRSDSVKALEENLRVVEAGYKNGSYTKLSFLRAGVAAANETTRLIDARKESELAKAAFNLHLGREADVQVVLDESALQLESPEDKLIIGMKEGERMSHYKELVAIALKNRPELIGINHKKSMLMNKEMESESVYLWPSFFVNGSYGSSKIINPQGAVNTGDYTIDYILNGINGQYNPKGWNNSWNFTVGATYRWGALSPADSSHGKSGQFESLSKQTDMELEEFVRSIKLEIQDGLLSINSSSHAILSQKDNIKSAEESYRVAIIQFKNGMIDNTELLNANIGLSSAKTMYVQSLYDFQVSKARLNRALGYDYFRF
ncbi:MAG TPA: TolC family protein [Spirochaetota bacterium]|nr:TolC family protein [Spirochaetota bacterium]